MEHLAELFEGWKRGNTADGEALLEALFPPLFRFFRDKVTDGVEDLIQKTLLDCLESRDSVEDPSRFRAFVFRVARNRLFDQLRSDLRHGEHVPLSELSLEDLGVSPSSYAASNERKLLLGAALRRLPLDQQIALELRYWHGLNAEEIGEIQGIGGNTSRSRITRARVALREHLRELGAAEDLADSMLR